VVPSPCLLPSKDFHYLHDFTCIWIIDASGAFPATAGVPKSRDPRIEKDLLQPKRKKRKRNARHGADNDQDQESDVEDEPDHPNPPVVDQVEHEEEHEVDEGHQALQEFGDISDQLDAFNVPQPPQPEEDEDPGAMDNAVPAAAANAPPAQPQPLDVEQSIRHENAIRLSVGKLL